ncbi:uncharacterized protein LOC120258315 [Dioscorea cayenensis subsp. rotundata]|uniref:Uncharacterized protein LOC120258315 n=1 Tax=Dioscorea cayennensis subsp. rotundata TaxID=55577 RepID=A0AB40B2R5_DIOCR|nr:uncharacterized protein LOC120258315 [Dioscorea cayenensis subsp. rotundata]
MMQPANLMAKNEVGDTALHVAAAMDSLSVATALIDKNPNLIEERNNKLETPLLKAALFGSAATFHKLKRQNRDGVHHRTLTGASVLHCAILGNNPDLALEIAQEFGFLIYTRNLKALTPLQLIVTIPQVFRSSLELGPAESFLYTFIPLDSHDKSNQREKNIDDEELGKSISHHYWVESNAKSDKLFEASEAMSKRKFVKKYQLIWYFFYVAKLVGLYLDASRVRLFIIFILKKLFNSIEELEILKTNHVQTMKLIAYLARDPEYWDFINKGTFKKKQTDMKPENMIFKRKNGDDDEIDKDFDDEEDFDDFDDDDDDDDDDEEEEEEEEEEQKIDNQNTPLDGSNRRTTSSLHTHKELVSSDSLNERTTSSLPKEKDLILEHAMNLISEQKKLISEQKNLIIEQNNSIKEFTKQIKSSLPEPAKRQLTRWAESPLIVGAKMGLYDFVEQILKVYPQSAQFKDLEGKNVLQVAIKHGQVKIVKIIAEMIKGPNPMLPSWLLSDVTDDEMNKDDEMNNTILHYAAVTTIKDEGFALQMQREIIWFETVKKLVPKDMVNNRNAEEKTAQELFNENHAEMMKSGRNQLMDIGKTCSGLLAAVVFATSFNIPGGKDSDSRTGPSNNNMTNSTKGNHFNDESVGFKVFSHAYVMGLSFATCSLLLFLSLLTSNYRPEAFRKALPTKYILAVVSFFFALLTLLVAFTCNIYLSIYGGGTPKAKDLLPLVLELTGFPFLCAVALFFGGFSLRFSDFILRMLHR